MSAWHAKRTEEVLKELGTGRRSGLSEAEAGKRLGRYGRNELEHQEPEGMLRRFLAQMRDPMILVLLAAAILSLLASGGEDWIDAVIILVIVVVNAIISISQEDSAEKALEALRNMSAPLAKVIRDGGYAGWRRPFWSRGISFNWRPGTWCPPTPGCWRRTASRQTSPP